MTIGTQDGYWFTYAGDAQSLEVYKHESLVAVQKDVDTDEVLVLFDQVTAHHRKQEARRVIA